MAGGLLCGFLRPTPARGYFLCHVVLTLHSRADSKPCRRAPQSQNAPPSWSTLCRHPNSSRTAHPRSKPPAKPLSFGCQSRAHTSTHFPSALRRLPVQRRIASLAVVRSRCVHAKTTPKHHNTIFTDLEAGG